MHKAFWNALLPKQTCSPFIMANEKSEKLAKKDIYFSDGRDVMMEIH